jgi:protease-4
MPAETDVLVERRQLRRKLTVWRAATFLVALLAVLGLGLYAARDRLAGGGLGAHVARVKISGVITGDSLTLDLLKRVGKSNASAVLSTSTAPAAP